MSLLKNLIPAGFAITSILAMDANATVHKHIPKPYVPENTNVAFQVHSPNHSCLVAAAWNEARGRTDKEITGVMSVVLNRSRHPDYPSTICGVVLEKGQFQMSPKIRKVVRLAKSGKNYRKALGSLEPADAKALIDLDIIAGRVIKGYVADPTKGATHFYTPSMRKRLGLPADPSWAKRMSRTASIGEFRFMKVKKSKS